jgi:hypothetical protein
MSVCAPRYFTGFELNFSDDRSNRFNIQRESFLAAGDFEIHQIRLSKVLRQAISKTHQKWLVYKEIPMPIAQLQKNGEEDLPKNQIIFKKIRCGNQAC